MLVKLETYKGWVFVAATAALIYFERRRADRGIKRCAAIIHSSDDAIIGPAIAIPMLVAGRPERALQPLLSASLTAGGARAWLFPDAARTFVEYSERKAAS